MAVSIDRYVGVTRPLNYHSIMTTRRTIYLIILIWMVSLLTSVVPLFGLTDRKQLSSNSNIEQAYFPTCKVNKNTFYTIFSSTMSFYIPVVVLLILYSRIYQEAQQQSKKLENERRRLYQIDYQLASEDIHRKQRQTNGFSTDKKIFNERSLSQTLKTEQIHSTKLDVHKNELARSIPIKYHNLKGYKLIFKNGLLKYMVYTK